MLRADEAVAPPLPTTDEEREAFHKLLNIENFPEFRETARQYARAYLANANYAADPTYAEFDYTEERLHERMKFIYDSFVENTMYTSHFYDQSTVTYAGKEYPVGKASNKVVIDNLIQKAPFNFLDGVWLQNIMTARPSDEVMSKLFDIWADEAGNGEVEQNHANVYDNLLRSKGVYLPSVNSREFIDYPFVPGAWRTGVFQQCVGLFPQEFFPELLGMTLYLEWEATPTLTPSVRMLRGRGIDPLFYQLHVAIDNISEGHGALAIEAIKAFLAEQRLEGGDDEVQRNWKRIWNGYVTWATVGFLGTDTFMRRLIIDKKKLNIGTPKEPSCVPDLAGFYRDQMLALVRKKAPFAKQVHGGVSLGGKPLNSLFDKPEELLNLLLTEGLVDPKHPRDSNLIALMQFEGPMYRVFSDKEQAVVLDWIESADGDAYDCIEPLPPDTDTDPAVEMEELISKYASQAQFAHASIKLTTQAGEQKPLATLFDRPAELMGALVASGWARRCGLLGFQG
ncbi:iron-containing redox enzyme family protein [Rhizobium sp. P28RR-XV]|uniref:iron-containing redox enzyme family protein n=1 Tax=Rhizobium sp. P28RR-XV TaxID=2726737 RepID=UPI001456BD52|nr:iron-containing redox enzyme family protein [Rhizobium sp. P28RR-XV]NLR89548.1 iron-containing redox enzyme family protein [Rhizobium sp. P28RR-XV]